MKLNETKCTILENDEEHRGLDRGLSQIMKWHPQIKFDIWYRFSSSFYWAKEENMKRLAQLGQDKDHFFLIYPSFIGYDNTLDGWIHLFNKLTIDHGFKSKFVIMYSGNMWYELLSLAKKNRDDNRERLKNVLENNDIYWAKYIEVNLAESFEEIDFQKITYKSLMDGLYKRGDKAKIKETGQICKVVYQFIHVGNDEESSYSEIDLIVDEIMYEKACAGEKMLTSEYAKGFKLDEIEKV